MRQAFRVAGSLVVFTAGMVWLVLDIVGTAATALDLFEWIPLWIRKVAAHEELAYQVAPWFLMGLGVVSLLLVHLWPERRAKSISPEQSNAQLRNLDRHDLPRQNFAAQTQSPELRVSPKMVRAMRLATQVAKAGEEIALAYKEADRKLLRREELQEQAHLAQGFDERGHEARDAAVLLLAHLRSEGVELRNEAANVIDTSLEDWLAEIEEWREAVVDGVALIDEADAEILNTLDTVPQARITFLVRVVDPERVDKFLHHFRMHDLRLSRLWDLLQKYQGVTFRRG